MKKKYFSIFLVHIFSFIWSVLIHISAPFILRIRLKKKLEEISRYKERYGKALIKRPKGILIWLHGASVGESLSLLPIIDILQQKYPKAHFLISTTTVSAALILNKRLPKNCFHQYIPYDAKRYVQSFLNHWQPNAVIFTESELWPNMLLALKNHHIKTFLFNARFSEKSFQSWHYFSWVARILFSSFQRIYTQSDMFTAYYQKLGIKNVSTLGNIKILAKTLPFNNEELELWQDFISDRLCWVAASTHAGEEEKIFNIHNLLKKHIPDLLTIIIPRHIERCTLLTEQLKGNICTFEKPNKKADILLVDVYAKVGIFYSLCPIAFIGGSLVPIGCHNPLEALALSCFPLWGPYDFKIKDMEYLFEGIPCQQNNTKTLYKSVKKYLENPDLSKIYVKKLKKRIEKQQKKINHVIENLDFLSI